MGLTKERAYQKERDQALKHISQEHDQACLCSEHADRVRRSRIAASVFTDVDSVHLSENIRRLEISERITNQKT